MQIQDAGAQFGDFPACTVAKIYDVCCRLQALEWTRWDSVPPDAVCIIFLPGRLLAFEL